MVLPGVKAQILSDLDQLSQEEQKRAADLVHRLVSPLPRGASGRDLLRFAGTLDPGSAREMMEAIEEGCERVDLDVADISPLNVHQILYVDLTPFHFGSQPPLALLAEADL